ncbi:hypothetical protein AB205_0018280 [Aquarana catesbeiana]|uniref:Uncharacterized protein n=1 Tax=Aquarana catesbeiana TaxID=8400 RepID=A0A2G9RUD6_AQUCT|nr:hypothetical protein AB205_0018280 [Aquarana catesbeiana]
MALRAGGYVTAAVQVGPESCLGPTTAEVVLRLPCLLGSSRAKLRRSRGGPLLERARMKAGLSEGPDVSKDDDPMYRDILKQITKAVGESRNYGLTMAEQAELELREAEESISQELKRKAELERREAEEEAERMARWEEWNSRLEEVKRQERELLEAQSVPLRNYLMKNVMPTLIQGLNECIKVRPGDPVDYLAEYLFKNNPEIE